MGQGIETKKGETLLLLERKPWKEGRVFWRREVSMGGEEGVENGMKKKEKGIMAEIDGRDVFMIFALLVSFWVVKKVDG